MYQSKKLLWLRMDTRIQLMFVQNIYSFLKVFKKYLRHITVSYYFPI